MPQQCDPTRNRLTQVRMDAGLQQYEVAYAIDASVMSYNGLESGRIRPFNYPQGWTDIALRIAEFFQMDPAELLGDPVQLDSSEDPIEEPLEFPIWSDDQLMRMVQPDKAVDLHTLVDMADQTRRLVLWSVGPRNAAVWDRVQDGRISKAERERFSISRQRCHQIAQYVDQKIQAKFQLDERHPIFEEFRTGVPAFQWGRPLPPDCPVRLGPPDPPKRRRSYTRAARIVNLVEPKRDPDPLPFIWGAMEVRATELFRDPAKWSYGGPGSSEQYHNQHSSYLLDKIKQEQTHIGEARVARLLSRTKQILQAQLNPPPLPWRY